MLNRFGWYCAGATGGLMMLMAIMMGDINGKLNQGIAMGILGLCLPFGCWLLFEDYFNEKSSQEENIKKD